MFAAFGWLVTIAARPYTSILGEGRGAGPAGFTRFDQEETHAVSIVDGNDLAGSVASR